MCLKWIMVQLFRMVRTVKLSYTTAPPAIEIITQWRKAQSVVIRTAYNRVREGKKDKEILDLLRVKDNKKGITPCPGIIGFSLSNKTNM